MTNAQQKAWAILIEEEKVALNLSLVEGKSTWESGEIMNKAHYKYLEIRQRAEKFMKIFTDYFNEYDTIIPKYINAPSFTTQFKKFIRLSIEERLPIKETVKKLGDENWLISKIRDEEIRKGIKKLRDSKITQDQNLFHLIMDFDRWNNFRILPLDVREPSAFKRRNKQRLKKLVNLSISLNPIAILKLKQIYQVKAKDRVNSFFYLPLICKLDPSKNCIIQVSKSEKGIKMINDLLLYGFESERDAKDFIEIITGYTNKEYKHCTEGQKFWPEFRLLTKKAINHDNLQNITPSRKYVLDNAGKDYDFQLYLSKREKYNY